MCLTIPGMYAIIHSERERKIPNTRKENAMYNNFSRPCTDTELRNFHLVESIVETLSDEDFERVVEVVSGYVFSFEPHERRVTYSRVYRLGKRYGVTVQTLVDWYCID